MKKQDYPILEFDPAIEAIIEPTEEIENIDAPEHCVLCFPNEVVGQLSRRESVKVIKEFHWESGPHIVYQMEIDGRPLAFLQPGIGGPLAAGLLEGCIALGCRKFIACGAAGVLDSSIPPEHAIIVTSALRDEGISYHYVPPSREIAPNPEGTAALEEALTARSIPFTKGKTWTTDAPYRETRTKIQQRRAEGCITVEMEAASLFAVAQFRSVTLGQLLYGGDDVSGEIWDQRDWKNRTSAREKLFWLAAEACLKL